MKAFGFAVLLFTLWIFLSGHFTPLLLILGGVSVVLTVYISMRMDLVDHESYPIHISPKLPAFFVYIIFEIVLANIDVVKRIFKVGGKNISPEFIEVPVPQKTDLGRAIYANAITLTPGTVSVDLGEDKVLVHALTKEAAEELLSGEMAKMIPDIEVGK